MSIRTALWTCAACIALAQPAMAADDAGLDFFEKKIRPVLVERCYKCHSAETKMPKGGLVVDSRAGLHAGGESGAAVVPGKAGESLLLSAIEYAGEFYDMPPDGKLPDEVIADFRRWIEMGAPDPRESNQSPAAASAGIDVEAGRQFWSFRPIERTAVPTVADAVWPKSDIDRFLLAKLEADRLRPAADADRATLLRRVTFDLTGLPPTLEAIDAFERDTSSGALATVVDRLLDSPHFGERWGRHWLDVARYAESSGGGRSMVFNDAWRYRDYVIRSFNADKPFDRFITEQVAGDLLPHASIGERSDNLVATAYLMLGPINYEEQDKDQLDMDIADEQIDTLGRSLLGMTIGCARCHDHKFDPIPTKDYYALAGIFRSTNMVEHTNVSNWTLAQLPMQPEVERAWNEHQTRLAALDKQIGLARREAGSLAGGLANAVAPSTLPGLVLDDQQAEKVGSWAPSTSTKPYIGNGYVHDGDSSKGEKTLTFAPKFTKSGMYEVRVAYTPGRNRASRVPIEILHVDGEFECFVNQREQPPVEGRFASLGKFRFDETNQWFVMVSNLKTDGHVVVDAVQFLPEDEEETDRAPEPTAAADARGGAVARLKELEAQKKALEKQAPERPMAMAVSEAAKVGDCELCIRGNVHTRGDAVPRGFVQVATLSSAPAIPAGESGRRQLAEWLTSRDNPLVARVMANRVWHYLFGVGLVRTVDNFGTTGETPSHPELLDHLAIELVEGGWSIKRLIRQVALSRAYQMSTADDERAAKIDPENRLLWRANRRRLDAESIRDAMLTVSGRLDRTMYGLTIQFDSAKGLSAAGEYGYTFADSRRSVYTPVFRNRLHELFEVFDFADPNSSLGSRNTSTVAPQALYFLNNDFVMEQSRLAAAAELARPAASDEERVERAFRMALGRRPMDRELEISLAAIHDSPPRAARLAAWSRLYQALFASIDFRYLE